MSKSFKEELSREEKTEKRGTGAFFSGQEEKPKKSPKKKTPSKKAPKKKPASQKPKSSVSQETKRPGGEKKDAQEPKYKAFTKVNYYLEPELVKRIKLLAVQQGKELSELADEAMRDLLKKHKAR